MDAQNLNFIFADKALPKQGKLFYSRLIQSPEIVKDIDFDSIIIATSEMKYHEVKNELSSYYAQSNRQFAKVFILGELMNPNFKSKIL